MGKKYLETKNNSLESSVLGVWQTAIEEGEAINAGIKVTQKAIPPGRTAVGSRMRTTPRPAPTSTTVSADHDPKKKKKSRLAAGIKVTGRAPPRVPLPPLVRADYDPKKENKEEVELDPNKLPNMREALMKVRTEKHDTHVDPEDREELDKEPENTAKKMKRSKEPAPNISEASGDKEAYKKFFNAALKKFKVSSPAELKGDQKKKFYDYIDAGWEADNEKAEAAMSQVREFKIQSMKAALAQVWGMEEGKNPFKTEDHDDDEENKKKVKTETGKKPAVIDLKPKIDDR